MQDIPLGLMLMDYLIGAAMYALLIRFILALVMPEHAKIIVMRMIVYVTDPLLKSSQAITPNFIIDRIKPIYLAWLIFIIRFYFIPIMLGYEIYGVSSLPLEGGIAHLMDQITGLMG